MMDAFRAVMEKEDRSLDGFGMEAVVFTHPEDRPDFGGRISSLDDAFHDIEVWRAEGVTHVSLHSMATGARTVPAHIDFLDRVITGL